MDESEVEDNEETKELKQPTQSTASQAGREVSNSNNNDGDDDNDDDEQRGFYDLEEKPELGGQQAGGAEEEEEEEDAEDLVADGMEKDYKPQPELDHYDVEMLDPTKYAPITADQRKEAENELRERDRTRLLSGRGGQSALNRARWLQRVPALMFDDEQQQEEEAISMRQQQQQQQSTTEKQVDDLEERDLHSKRRRTLYDDEKAKDQQEDEGVIDSIEDEEKWLKEIEQPFEPGIDHAERDLREWLALEGTRKEVGRRFKQFLLTFQDSKSGVYVYRKGIQTMCAANKESLIISFTDLSNSQPTLSTWVTEEPVEVLRVFDEIVKEVTFRLLPKYKQIVSDIHVRIADLPIADTVRDLRQYHLNHLIKVNGVVTRRTSVFPQLTAVKYDCPSCHTIIGPFSTADINSLAPSIAACPTCHSRGPFTLNTEHTVYRNYQKITLQESPGSVPPGRLPRSKEVILLCDLIDSSKPGEEIEVIGIYRHSYDLGLNRSHGFPVFSTIIEANNVTKRDDVLSAFKLTEEDEQKIRRLASDDRILTRITKSIAPSICGHEDVKLALALSLFGGETRILQDQGQHRIRGDINILLLGDPGTAKFVVVVVVVVSQFLKFVEKTSHRAIFTTGKGSTAVGLTASVHRDAITKEWTLEGGALVLADRGICLIDEFDKMNDKDRTSIHEAMEQQSISISKAGIVTSLQARCAVIAAANPVKGRYNSSLPFKDNVELTEPILSRFDILLVIKDRVNPIEDENLARFVVQSHVLSHPLHKAQRRELGEEAAAIADVDDRDIIPQDLLRKYIMYAKAHIRPKWLNKTDFAGLANTYSAMRTIAQGEGGFPICMRHVESAMRMAEACSKIHLREHVQAFDMKTAIRVMLESFIGTHKESVSRNLRRRFKEHIDFGKENNELLLHLLISLFTDCSWMRSEIAAATTTTEQQSQQLEIDRLDFESRAQEKGISDFRIFYSSKLFSSKGFKITDSKIIKIF